jgi:hypothetical protein
MRSAGCRLADGVSATGGGQHRRTGKRATMGVLIWPDHVDGHRCSSSSIIKGS